MAENSVAFVLKNLLPWFENEINLSREVHKEVEYMREELERMRGDLQLADATDDVNENMKICIRQMRNVAYDTEDVLEEFMLRLARDPGDGCFGFVCKMIGCIMNFRARHEIASSIKVINGRIERIYKRLPNDAFSSLDQSSSSSVTAQPTWHDPRGDALLLAEAELVGFENPMKTLIGWLLEEKSERGTISVAGIGGLGKTTLVKKVYDDEQVKRHFDCHAWITISHSFQVKRLLKDIIQQLFHESKQKDPAGLDTMNQNELKKMIKQFLQQKKYLVVFDDIWSTAAWEDLQHALPKTNCSSWIVVTTRSSDIASYCKSSYGAGYVYDLEPLDPIMSWNLFCNKAFEGKTCLPHLEGLARSIWKRCEGLPLAIVAIGALLKAMKDNTSTSAWEIINRSLPAELEKNDNLKSLNKVLLLSYSHLPYYLKPCFLYLSIFPEDYTIKPMRLIRLWMAEGFIEEQAGRTLEEVGANYLNELINRSLVQVAKTNIDGRIRRCRVHDLIREIILSKSKDQNMGTMIDERETSQPERIRSLLIHRSCDNIPPTKSLSLLRSLIMMKVHTLSNCKFLGGLRLLKVLDLRGVPLETFPGEVTNLFHLRYLCLRRSKISMLPNSIERLQNLETLDLKHTSVSELPIGNFKLQKLRHLLVYAYNIKGHVTLNGAHGFKVRREIGRLTKLQKLCYIVIDNQCNNGGIVIKELGKLNQLRRLGIESLLSEDGKYLCYSMEKMSNLQSLCIRSIAGKEALDLQSLSSPPTLLQRLYLEGHLEKLPHWISSLSNLSTIVLRWSNLRDDPLEVLEALPNLIDLELLQAYDGELLSFKASKFQRLQRLDLNKLDGLRWVRLEKGTMPLLQKLEIGRCELLEKVPLGIEDLPSLKELLFYDMPKEFTDRLNPDEGEDHSKVSHIPDVYIKYMTDLGWDTHIL